MSGKMSKDIHDKEEILTIFYSSLRLLESFSLSMFLNGEVSTEEGRNRYFSLVELRSDYYTLTRYVRASFFSGKDETMEQIYQDSVVATIVLITWSLRITALFPERFTDSDIEFLLDFRKDMMNVMKKSNPDIDLTSVTIARVKSRLPYVA